jgi:glycosyltransferase involved in cell wall biosynthesis
VTESSEPRSRRVCLVGSGWRFTSGISYYTCLLANAFADSHDVAVIQMRQLMPRHFYPGRRRVGQQLAYSSYRPDIPVYDGVNWWWGRSLMRAVSFIASRRSEVLVLEWWTATVLHTYLVLALAGRLFGARIIVELHELQDSGERNFALARWYGQRGLGVLLRLAHGCVVHSTADKETLKAGHGVGKAHVTVALHGPFNQYHSTVVPSKSGEAAIAAVKQAPRTDVINLLFFGTIRPYKGLEDLIETFNEIDAEEVSDLWLTVVGETWENCTEPARLIAASPHRDRISFVNEYVADDVVGAAFSHADVVVLPYRRSSSSGPLHVTMSWGLPVIVTCVGGLPEAAAGYGGAIFVPPNDRQALKAAIWQARRLVGRRFADPSTSCRRRHSERSA